MRLPLPFDTRKDIFKEDKNLKFDLNIALKASNLGLLFNKFVFAWTKNWGTEETVNNKKINKKTEFQNKVLDNSSVYTKMGKDIIAAAYNRQRASVQSLQSSGWHVLSFEAITDSRLIIGLGGTSVIETGMTLHPLYGFPYLPGSGLKGLARAYAEIAEDPKPSGDDLCEIFGSEDKSQHFADNRQGKVFFMDGLPTAFPKLELDIMNPHYGKYYQGEKDSKGNPIPPADYLNPVPVTFLTVAAGETFSFCFYSRHKELATKAKKWLIGGLTQLGAGGKTNVGYGYFKIEESNTQGSTNTVQPLSVTKKTTIITSETVIWENTTLTWSPGNQILKAIKDNQKAELKVSDKNIVPSKHQETLFTKKKPIIVNVTVEKIGNAFKIVSIL
jgi:CRISPR-associated protein Cmr6